MQSLGVQSLTYRGKGTGRFQNPEKERKGHTEELELNPSDPCVHELGEYTLQVTYFSVHPLSSLLLEVPID